MSDPELLNINDAAMYLGGVSRSTVYHEHQRGRLRFVKVGGSTFVRRSELDRYLKASERNTDWMRGDCGCPALSPDGDGCDLTSDYTNGLCSHCEGHRRAFSEYVRVTGARP